MSHVHRNSSRAFPRGLLVTVALAAAALLVVPGALASPPDNDLFANAQSISSLPFADAGNLGGTTTEPGEPQACNYQAQSVWYSYTPQTTTPIRIDLDGSDFGVVANIWQSYGGGIYSLGYDGCLGFGGSQQLTANAGTTYYIQVGSVSFGSAYLQLHVAQIAPPPNDDFANAKTIGSLPYSDQTDRTAATMETGEPVSTSCGQISHTIWYRYTPAVDQILLANGNAPGVNSFMAVYTGDSLANLTETACKSEHNVFPVKAGKTYYVQVGSYDGQAGASQSFSLDIAPAPSIAMFVNPSDPSTFDSTQFSAYVFDPAASGSVQSEHWDFGDGTAADGFSVSHRYAADGTYIAGLTVTMTDGRVGTGTVQVTVTTHDVAISKFNVPETASAGQTKTISVSLANRRYPEHVQLTLAKSVGGGFADVASATLDVPVAKATDYRFSYVFSDDDAAIGKVTFRVTATILGARDALPADNSITALATRVK